MKTIDDLIKMQRSKSFENSPQLTLGQLIEKIEECGLTYGPDNKLKEICFDFASAIPTTLDSWRGAYEELALGYNLSGYDNNQNHSFNNTASNLLTELKSALGKVFTGWKGGDFVMDENTPVWVDNPGNANNTGIIDVIDDGWHIILITAYCKY